MNLIRKLLGKRPRHNHKATLSQVPAMTWIGPDIASAPHLVMTNRTEVLRPVMIAQSHRTDCAFVKSFYAAKTEPCDCKIYFAGSK